MIRATVVVVLVWMSTSACMSEQHEARAREAPAHAPSTSSSVPTTQPPARRVAEDMRRAIGARLKGAPPATVTPEQWRLVRILYERTTSLPVWLDTAGDDRRARALVQELAIAPSHGLVVDAARVDTLHAALVPVWGAGAASAEHVADAEVLLSAAFVALAQDLLGGQLDPRAATRGWHIAPRRGEIDSMIVQRALSASSDTAFASLAPDDPVYASLRDQLASYREIVARGGWGTVPAGPALRNGSRGDTLRLHALAKRLAREGYLSDSAWTGETYDSRLAEAVSRYQSHHAMNVDGVLSAPTVKALNVPATYRVGQIAANLERIRWLPRAMRARHLIVNVPSFRLLMREGARTVSSMKVVVGAEFQNRATPVFADSMSYVVFQPYWNVTPTIGANEIVPKASRDAGYLARNDYEVVRGDGDDAPVVSGAQLTSAAVRAGRVRIRQRPGKLNALGHAKFIFPNSYNIYLHDTPQRALFDRDVRAFSHGCIRVQRPDELAAWVLGWDSTRVAAAMSGARPNQYAPLARKLPVFILYLTAFMRDGELYFGNDLYARDADLVHAIDRGALPDTRTRTALDRLAQLANR